MANLLFNYNFVFNYNCNAAARYGLACGSSLSPGCAGGGGIAAAAVFASDPLCVPRLDPCGPTHPPFPLDHRGYRGGARPPSSRRRAFASRLSP